MIRLLALMHFWELAIAPPLAVTLDNYYFFAISSKSSLGREHEQNRSRGRRPNAYRIHPFLTSIIVFLGMIETYRLTYALDLTKIACMVRRLGKSAISRGPAPSGVTQFLSLLVGRLNFSCRRLRPVRTVFGPYALDQKSHHMVPLASVTRRRRYAERSPLHMRPCPTNTNGSLPDF